MMPHSKQPSWRCVTRSSPMTTFCSLSSGSSCRSNILDDSDEDDDSDFEDDEETDEDDDDDFIEVDD